MVKKEQVAEDSKVRNQKNLKNFYEIREPDFYVPTDRGVDMADGIIVSSAYKLFAIQVAMRKKNTIVRAGMKELGEKFKTIDLIFVIRQRHFKTPRLQFLKKISKKGIEKRRNLILVTMSMLMKLESTFYLVPRIRFL